MRRTDLFGRGAAMKTGKISESILIRSVLRQIKNHENVVVKGAGVGEDCAFLSWENPVSEDRSCEKEQDNILAVSAQTVTLPIKNAAYLAVMAAANNLAASGAIPSAATLALTLPEAAQESLLKEMMRQADSCCQQLNIQIAGGHTEVSSAVRWPVVTVTVMGARQGREQHAHEESIKKVKSRPASAAGLDIVVSKWIGMEGTSIIAGEKERELLKRYPNNLILMAKEQADYLSIASEAAIALKSGVYAMHDARNGGIFGALWEVSRKLGVGLCIDLKKIPVRQETIEICEFYNLNPYELLSGGALIMLTHHGQELVKSLEDEGISAAVIGSTNDGNDKIVTNQDETRYLEPPVPDEIYKLSFI